MQDWAHRYDDPVSRPHPEAVVGHEERGDPHEAESELASALNENGEWYEKLMMGRASCRVAPAVCISCIDTQTLLQVAGRPNESACTSVSSIPLYKIVLEREMSEWIIGKDQIGCLFT